MSRTVAREVADDTLTVSVGRSRLVVHTGDADTWVVLDRSWVEPPDAAALGRALAAEAPGVELLLWDADPANALDAAVSAGGWVPRARKVFVEGDLEAMDAAAPAANWAVETLADLGVEEFAARMLRAAEGDPFDRTTPENAVAELEYMIAWAGDSFDASGWLAVSDTAGELGIVLPQQYPDDAGSGTLFYVGVVPGRRGCGLGARLHRFGLGRLRDRGVRRYLGSTDERNTAMRRVLERNGAVETRVQTFYERRPLVG